MPPRTETELVEQAIRLAQLQGWMVTHVRPAGTAHGPRTPYQGHAGLPDLILARDGDVLLWELKGPRGKPTDGQTAWIHAAGLHGALYRPGDWDEIRRILTRPRLAWMRVGSEGKP